jgi:serine/threonine protein kinase
MRVHGHGGDKKQKDLYFSHGRHLDLRTAVVTNYNRVGRVTNRTTPSRTPFTTRPAQSRSHHPQNQNPQKDNQPTRSRRQHQNNNSDEIGRHLPEKFLNTAGNTYFRADKQLGQGGFSVCYLVEDEEGLPMAGKFFTRKASSSRKRLERFEREVKLMQNLNHPNIVKFYDAISGVKDDKKFDDFRRGEHVSYNHPPVMFIEYCSGGSLSSFLKNRARYDEGAHRYGTMSEKETRWVAYCVCRALVYLMEKQILHRDIKLGNLLLQQALNPKESLVNAGIVLCDFGLATQLKENELLAYGTAGTPYYIAREVVLHEGACYASDIWSLGVTLFYCLTGRAPFNSKSRSTSGIYRKIRRMDYRWKSYERERISREMRHMVNSMLEQEPTDRPKPDELLKNIIGTFE